MELVAVVMGADSSNERFTGAKKLLDYGFANWSFVSLSPDLKDLASIPVLKGMEKQISVDIGNKQVELLLPKGKQDEIVQTVELKENIEAPIFTGDEIGSVKFTLDGKQIGELPLCSANTVERVTFLNAFELIFTSAVTP